MSATKERLNEATKGVREAMRLEKKKGQEFTAFISLMKASHVCKQLAAEPAWSDKQRKNLNNSAKKADEGIQRLTIKLTPDQLDDAMKMMPEQSAVGGTSTDPNGVELMVGETDEEYTARQMQLRADASARMAEKFGGAGVSGQSLGSAPAAVPVAAAAPVPAPAAAPQPRMCRAIHGWDEESGAGPGDLLFDGGDVFELVSDTTPGSGWWTGTHDGFAEGIFPANYVELIVPEPAPASAPPPPPLEPEPEVPPAALQMPAAVAQLLESDDDDFENYEQPAPPVPQPETYGALPGGVGADPRTSFVAKPASPSLPTRGARTLSPLSAHNLLSQSTLSGIGTIIGPCCVGSAGGLSHTSFLSHVSSLFFTFLHSSSLLIEKAHCVCRPHTRHFQRRGCAHLGCCYSVTTGPRPPTG